MEEIEVPMEHLHEAIQEKAKEDTKEKGSNWSMYVAISTAFLAVLAAIAGLMAGHHSNEALIDQIKASDQWAYYQAKDIKIEIQSTAIKVDSNAIAKYQKKKDESYKSAKEAEESSKFHLAHHVKLAEAVTIFQIAIAISAIAILSRKKILWYVALLFSGLALFFFITGLL